MTMYKIALRQGALLLDITCNLAYTDDGNVFEKAQKVQEAMCNHTNCKMPIAVAVYIGKGIAVKHPLTEETNIPEDKKDGFAVGKRVGKSKLHSNIDSE